MPAAHFWHRPERLNDYPDAGQQKAPGAGPRLLAAKEPFDVPAGVRQSVMVAGGASDDRSVSAARGGLYKVHHEVLALTDGADGQAKVASVLKDGLLVLHWLAPSGVWRSRLAAKAAASNSNGVPLLDCQRSSPAWRRV